MIRSIVNITADEIDSAQEELYYNQLPGLLDAYARTTYGGVRAFDLYRMQFVHVTGNTLSLGGLAPSDIHDLGAQYYSICITTGDKRVIVNATKQSYRFVQTFDVEQRPHFTLSYCVNVKESQSGKYFPVCHLTTPLCLTQRGNVWIVLIVDYIPTYSFQTSQDVILRKGDEWWLLGKDNQWTRHFSPRLSQQQLRMLQLACQGLSIEQTAKSMCLAVDTIKKMRYQLFRDLGVSNINEAITRVTNLRLTD